MNPVWARIQHINARAIMQVALPGFLAAVVGGLIQVARTDTGVPVPDYQLAMPDLEPVTNRHPRVWSTPDTVETASRNGLYGSAYLDSLYVALEEKEKRAAAAAESAPTGTVARVEAVLPPPEPEPPPPPPKERITLVYRGCLDRPDGTRMALIENRSAGESIFYPEQATLSGFVLAAFDRDGASLHAGLRKVPLPVGEAVEVELP